MMKLILKKKRKLSSKKLKFKQMRKAYFGENIHFCNYNFIKLMWLFFSFPPLWML